MPVTAAGRLVTHTDTLRHNIVHAPSLRAAAGAARNPYVVVLVTGTGARDVPHVAGHVTPRGALGTYTAHFTAHIQSMEAVD